MIVAFENNVVCSDEKVRDYLLAHHADLKEDQDEDALCLVRLHKEEDIDGTDRVDLVGWREISRELYWAGEQMECNYSIIRFSRKTTSLQMSVVLSTCNQLEWLEKVLWGYEAQDTKNFELIVADDGSPGSGGQFVYQFLGKSRLRKGLEWRGDMQPHHLPMSRHGVLARARLIQFRKIGERLLRRVHPFQGMQVCHAKLLQIEDTEGIRVFRNMSKRVRPRITVRRGVWQRAHAERINHNDKYSLISAHFCLLFLSSPLHIGDTAQRAEYPGRGIQQRDTE